MSPMVSHRSNTQPINGLLLLNKSSGMTSNAALQQVKRLFRAKKAGHTGSLDPLASGLLPICFGEATKFSQYLLDADKSYHVKAQLGVRTDTADQEGKVIAVRDIPALTLAQIDRVSSAFRGVIAQTPSMFSAIKHQGQPLYKLARQGIVVERKSRRIVIHQLTLLDYANDIITLTVHCSKGTYIRTLIDDLGERLGCGAHVTYLQRLTVGHFTAEQMVSLASLAQCNEHALLQRLLPLEMIVANWPVVTLTRDSTTCLRQGQTVKVPHAPSSGWVSLVQSGGQFIGVGEIVSNGGIAPRRLINFS